MMRDSVLPVIGLEIHVQLATRSKLFCGCANRFGQPPNTLTCPVCLGLPGALPVINREAVLIGIRVGTALHCRIPESTKWDRKSYYYPDLPKNYQISQYDHPLCVDGYLEIPVCDGPSMGVRTGNDPHANDSEADGPNTGVQPDAEGSVKVKKVRIRRAHLEEDAGKNTHDRLSSTGVDLNRAGIPLLEIVSEPDMNCAAEVLAYSRALRRLVRWLGASDAAMEMGQIRFEPNINLHIARGERLYKTPIVEVKNLNSFRALEATVEYEIERQYDEWLQNPRSVSLDAMGKQNRGFDVNSGTTVYQREKEEAHDYRYFPDPDLVTVTVGESRRQEIRDSLPELPWERVKRYRGIRDLSERDILFLTQEKRLGDLFDRTVSHGAAPKPAANLLRGKASALANRRNRAVSDLGLSPERLAELVGLLSEGRISSSTADVLLERMIAEDRSPAGIAEEEKLLVQKDPRQLGRWIDEVLAENPETREDIMSRGKTKALGFLVGQVMKKSRGRADPREVQKLLRATLGL